jgi:hypothetical protein
MEILPVNLEEPILNNTTINLSWDQYQGYYFSHYKIVVRNYSSDSGGGYQEEEFALIDDVETTSFSNEQPYFSNPVFVIYVYNIFVTKIITLLNLKINKAQIFKERKHYQLNK